LLAGACRHGQWPGFPALNRISTSNFCRRDSDALRDRGKSPSVLVLDLAALDPRDLLCSQAREVALAQAFL
jgi:hypothetical protein